MMFCWGKNDVLFVLTTSGNSENIYNAIIEAKKIGIITIGFLGKNGGKCKDLCDIEIIITPDVGPNPTARTPRTEC